MNKQTTVSESSSIDRRKFIKVAGLGAGAGLLGANLLARTARAATGDKPFAGQTLRVFVYSGAWEKGFNEHFVPRFETQTGAKVIVDPGWWDSIPKLKASPKGQPAFDLVLTDATQGYPAIKEGLFQTIDLGKIPNKSNFAASALDNWVVKDSYGITFPDSVMTLGYNKTMVNTPPTKWGDLLGDEYKGKLGMYNSFYMSLYTFACMKVSQEGKPGTASKEVADNLQRVIDFAKANRDRVKLWWPTSTDMALNLTQKNCALGNMHGTDMIPALKNSADLGAVVPAEDRAFVLLMWVVANGTKVKDLALEAMNMLLSEEVQSGFASAGSATAIPSVAAKIAAQDKFWGQIYPSTSEGLAAVQYYPYDTYMAHWDDIVKVWDREVLRKSA
ncbi:MAG: extracellular solute-binding protein [Verrucomicrobiota bacterium]|nr:extracellular solute-binding protein [Verrucomicrobiota bacterium]